MGIDTVLFCLDFIIKNYLKFCLCFILQVLVVKINVLILEIKKILNDVAIKFSINMLQCIAIFFMLPQSIYSIKICVLVYFFITNH